MIEGRYGPPLPYGYAALVFPPQLLADLRSLSGHPALSEAHQLIPGVKTGFLGHIHHVRDPAQ